MAFSDQRKTAFTFASDQTKQLITLSTAIVTVTISLVDKVFKNPTTGEKWFIGVSWILYVVSIVLGLATLMGLTYSVSEDDEPSIQGGWVRLPAFSQTVLFLAATLAFVGYGVLALYNKH